MSDLTPDDVEVIVQELRKLGWTVEPPAGDVAAEDQIRASVVDELLEERRQEAAREDLADVRFVAIGPGERAPWATLPLTCPTCGAGPLPLEESTGGDEAGIKLRFIHHCGGTWLRGDIDQ